jgi:hypothetical protein
MIFLALAFCMGTKLKAPEINVVVMTIVIVTKVMGFINTGAYSS